MNHKPIESQYLRVMSDEPQITHPHFQPKNGNEKGQKGTKRNEKVTKRDEKVTKRDKKGQKSNRFFLWSCLPCKVLPALSLSNPLSAASNGFAPFIVGIVVSLE